MGLGCDDIIHRAPRGGQASRGGCFSAEAPRGKGMVGDRGTDKLDKIAHG